MAKEGHWRVLQGKGGQRPQARRAGPSHSRKQGQLLQIPSSREMSTGTQVRRAVIRMLGPTQFQYSKLTGRSCFLGPHPLVYFLPLLLGSRSWPANWRYLESVLKSQSFWTYKNHYPKRHGLDPWVRKIPGRRKWQPRFFTTSTTGEAPYNEILLSHKKGLNFVICSNMNGLEGHYGNWNKSDKGK